MMSFIDRLQHGWDAFMNKDPTYINFNYGSSSSFRPDRHFLSYNSERTIVTAIYNRIAVDCSMIAIKHCKLDENGRYIDEIDSSLNRCFTIQANDDQTFKAFMIDAVLSLLDDGSVAIVPTRTNVSPLTNETFKIGAMRTAKIIEWYPKHVRVEIYNDITGMKEQRVLPKSMCCLVENPFYSVMNAHNSIAKRLTRKIALLDSIDEQNSAGKLDLIIQLPYVIRNDAKRQQAEERRKDIEMQLSGSKYGIAYTDGTEKITQLNRPVENQLLAQIESLTKTLYSQLGMTEEIMNGTASNQVTNNYSRNCIEVIISAIVDEMRRKFLTQTARTQRQDICFFREPFKMIPVTDIANIADVLSRNEIMSPNEFRQLLGLKPSDDPRADRLQNSNMPQADDRMYDEYETDEIPEDSFESIGDTNINNI